MKHMNSKISSSFGLIAIIALFGLSMYQINFNNPAVAYASTATSTSATTSCSQTLTLAQVKQYISSGQIKVSVSDSGGQAVATIVNNTCDTFSLQLINYQMYDQTLANQVFFNESSLVMIPCNSTKTITLALPSCMTQTDLYYGQGPEQLNNNNTASDITLAYSFYENTGGNFGTAAGNFCVHTVPLAGSCKVTPSTANIGDTVVWTASATGGTGSYTYAWSGATTGSNATEQNSFSSAGTKNATVTITSGTQSVTENCSTTINQPTPTLAASCAVNPTSANIGDTVTWSSNATGGTGSYTYSWSGAATGSSQTEQNSYSSAGTQTATVTVTSGTQTATQTCSTTINQPQAAALTISCAANPTNINVGSSINWTANAAGGDGNYTYSWSGTNNLSGSGSSVSQTYNYSGNQTATVTVTDNGQSAQATCNASVNQQQTSNLTGSCYANPSNVNVGQTVTWYATASGGNNNYTYSWSGSNNLTGNGSTVYDTYNYSGTQSASVAITSNGQTIYENCSTNVNQQYYPPTQSNIYASCTANPSSAYVGQPVTWTVNPSGGTGNYTYSWTGSNGLYGSGQSIVDEYSIPGQQTATVSVYSNGQSTTQTCTVYISQQVVTTLYTPPQPPQSGVYLTQVPYTGSTGTNVKLFVLGLIVWSAGLSYFLIRRKAKKAGVTMGQYVSDTVNSMVPVNSFVASAQATQNFLRTGNNNGLTETLESKAREMRAIISAEGLESIVRASQNDTQAALAALTKVIEANKTDHYDSGDWLTIGGEKVSAALNSTVNA